ncbi:MAG: 30S ribosomal protein S20 [Gammaproteobacteria bacterium]
MANSQSARKRARQAQRRRAHNASRRSMLRTSIRRVVRAIDQGDQESAQSAFAAAVPVIDRMAMRGIIHRNKATRQKKRLNAALKRLAAGDA